MGTETTFGHEPVVLAANVDVDLGQVGHAGRHLRLDGGLVQDDSRVDQELLGSCQWPLDPE
jgi:hypothetical protein